MKILVAMMKHETNTFSPVPTRLEDFGPGGPLLGRAAYETFRGSGFSMAGLIDAAEQAGAEIETPIAARALPSAPVQHEAFEHVSAVICEAVAKGCDALFLDLHGAMVTERFEDGEGELLERIRRLAPSLPIAVALDLHGNVTRRMVANCTTLVGYKTYPHLDMVETGRRAGDLLLASMRGELRPVLDYIRVPLLPSMVRMATAEGAMRDLVAAAVQAEQEGALAVSVFGGFPLADTADTGLSIVSMTDGDPDKARDICSAIADQAWSRRAEFTVEFEPLEESIARAGQAREWPVLLVDHADNCNTGGTQDTMAVIAEALRQNLTGIAAGPICDPEAVARMIEAGIGARVTLPVGGKVATDCLAAEPLELTGTVRTISDGRYVVSGPVFTGAKIELGRTVVLDTGDLELVVSEGRCEPLDLRMFRFVGIEPTEKKFVIIKSKMQYRPTFGAMAKQVIECNGTGVATMDLTKFTFSRLPSATTYPLADLAEAI